MKRKKNAIEELLLKKYFVELPLKDTFWNNNNDHIRIYIKEKDKYNNLDTDLFVTTIAQMKEYNNGLYLQ
jgi:hypothetical protein